MSRSRSASGQATTEFVLVTCVMFTIFIALFLVIGNLTVGYQKSSESTGLQTLSERIAEEVTVASTVADGYSRSFELPKDLLGDPYIITILSPPDLNFTELVVKNTLTGEELVTSLPPRVQGSLAPGMNAVTKQGGVITLTP